MSRKVPTISQKSACGWLRSAGAVQKGRQLAVGIG